MPTLRKIVGNFEMEAKLRFPEGRFLWEVCRLYNQLLFGNNYIWGASLHSLRAPSPKDEGVERAADIISQLLS